MEIELGFFKQQNMKDLQADGLEKYSKYLILIQSSILYLFSIIIFTFSPADEHDSFETIAKPVP